MKKNKTILLTIDEDVFSDLKQMVFIKRMSHNTDLVSMVCLRIIEAIEDEEKEKHLKYKKSYETK